MHGFWPSWADVPAASQKCWVGVEMQQSCHCKLEKVKSNQMLYLPHHQNSTGAHYTASEAQGNTRQCSTQLMTSPKPHLHELWELKKQLGLPRGNASWWCWFRIAVTRLLPGLANRVTPLFRETSEAYNIREKEKNYQNWPPVAHQSVKRFVIFTSGTFRMVHEADWRAECMHENYSLYFSQLKKGK